MIFPKVTKMISAMINDYAQCLFALSVLTRAEGK
jgi:hypothetical protein